MRAAAAEAAASNSNLEDAQAKQVDVAVEATVDTPATIEEAAQAVTFPIQIDVAVQASAVEAVTQQTAVPQQAAAAHAAQLPPRDVADMFCVDREYFEKLMKNQETESKENTEKRRKEQEEDLENIRQMFL